MSEALDKAWRETGEYLDDEFEYSFVLGRETWDCEPLEGEKSEK